MARADQTVLPRCGQAGGRESPREAGCALGNPGEGSFRRALGRTSQTTGLG